MTCPIPRTFESFRPTERFLTVDTFVPHHPQGRKAAFGSWRRSGVSARPQGSGQKQEFVFVLELQSVTRSPVFPLSPPCLPSWEKKNSGAPLQGPPRGHGRASKGRGGTDTQRGAVGCPRAIMRGYRGPHPLPWGTGAGEEASQGPQPEGLPGDPGREPPCRGKRPHGASR